MIGGVSIGVGKDGSTNESTGVSVVVCGSVNAVVSCECKYE